MKNDAAKRSIRLAALFALASMIPWPAAAGQAGYSAMVMDVKGQAVVLRAGAKLNLDLGGLLYPQDSVELAKDASLIIAYLASGREEHWPGGAKFVVEKDGSRPGPEQFQMKSRIQLPQIASAQKGSITMKGIVAYVDLEVGGLSNTRTIEARPAFCWSPIRSAQTYKVRLYRLSENEPVWQRTAKGGALPFPPEAPPLKPGESYRWIIEGFEDGALVGRKCSLFQLPPDQESAEIRREMEGYRAQLKVDASDASTRLRFVLFLEERQLYDDALEQYGILLGRPGAGRSLRERQGKILELRSASCQDR